jgi:hypothetical protein
MKRVQSVAPASATGKPAFAALFFAFLRLRLREDGRHQLRTTVAKASRAGVKHFLPKPCSADRLLSAGSSHQTLKKFRL